MYRKGWLDQRMREHEFLGYYAPNVRTGIKRGFQTYLNVKS